MESQIPILQVAKGCGRERIIRQVDYETLKSATISYCDKESPSKRKSVELDIQFLKDKNQTTQTRSRQKHMQVTIIPRVETVCIAGNLNTKNIGIPSIFAGRLPTQLLENAKGAQNKQNDGPKTNVFSSLGLKKSVKTPEGDIKMTADKHKPATTVIGAEKQKRKKHKGIPIHLKTQMKNPASYTQAAFDIPKTHVDKCAVEEHEIPLKNPEKPRSLGENKSVSLDSLLLPNSNQTFDIKSSFVDLDIKLLSNTMGGLEADLDTFIETCRRNVKLSELEKTRATKIRQSGEEVTTLFLKEGTRKHNIRDQKHDYATKLKKFQTGIGSQYSPHSTQVPQPEHNHRHDKATLMITNNAVDDDYLGHVSIINLLHKRVDELERKVQNQEVIRNPYTGSQTGNYDPETSNITEKSLDKNKYTSFTSSVAFSKCEPRKESNKMMLNDVAGMSKTSKGFLNNDLNPISFDTHFNSNSKVRPRRQSASMPLNKGSKSVSSRTLHGAKSHSHRKSDILKEYRLYDMVHYLAQGEFAPRNDGIKLTPSREAVLSDIIWEDVCRSHFPNTNLLQRRHYRKERRILHRTDVQKQIDKLLREGATYMEKRKRKSNDYRTVMNIGYRARARGLGTTRDFVVANSENNDIIKDNDNIQDIGEAQDGASQQFACESVEWLEDEEYKMKENLSFDLDPNLKKNDHEITDEVKNIESTLVNTDNFPVDEKKGKEALSIPKNKVDGASKRRRKLQSFANKYGYRALSESLEKDGIFLKVLIPLILGYKLCEKKRYTRQRRHFNKSVEKRKKIDRNANTMVSEDKKNEETQTSRTNQVSGVIISKPIIETGDNTDVERYSLDELATEKIYTHLVNRDENDSNSSRFVTTAYNAMVENNYLTNTAVATDDLNHTVQTKDNLQNRCRFGGFLQDNGNWILFDSLGNIEGGNEYLNKSEMDSKSILANNKAKIIQADPIGTLHGYSISKEGVVQSKRLKEKHYNTTKSNALDVSYICLPGKTRRHHLKLHDQESQTTPIMHVSCQCDGGKLRSQSCPRLIPIPCFMYYPSSVSFFDSVEEDSDI